MNGTVNKRKSIFIPLHKSVLFPHLEYCVEFQSLHLKNDIGHMVYGSSCILDVEDLPTTTAKCPGDSSDIGVPGAPQEEAQHCILFLQWKPSTCDDKLLPKNISLPQRGLRTSDHWCEIILVFPMHKHYKDSCFKKE